MRVKRVAICVILLAAAVIYAQDVAEIFNELKTKTVSSPLPPAPAPVQAPVQEPAAVAVPPAPAEEKAVVPAVTAVSAPVAPEPVAKPVDPAPAAVEAVVAAKPAVASEGGDVQNVAVAPELPGQGTIKGGLISLSLKEVELSSVIRLFATLSDANIIVPALEDKIGSVKVDVNLKNVEWKPALQAILDSHDLELYEKIPGTEVYSVRKKTANAPELMNVKTFKLDYATVSNVHEMIKGMVPDAGKISVFPARNTIVVQSSLGNLAEVEEMIKAVDLPRQQVFIEAKFMELSDSASKKLGIDWQVLGGYGVGLNGIGGTYDYSDSKKDGINNSRSYAENHYTDVSGRPYDNLEEVPDAPTMLPDGSGGMVNGIDYPSRPGSAGADASRIFGITPTTLSKSLKSATSVDESTVTRTLGATLSASDFKLILAALKEINGTKVVSNPKVIVANEELAEIHIGNKVPNVRGTTQTAGDSQRVTTYGLDEKEPYFEDGVKIKVTPTINTASNITVNIQPTLDQLESKATAFEAPDGTRFFGKTTKTINTIFSLASGQTAAIGGLTRTSSSDVERKVPLLGSIPLIGRLFSYSAVESGQAETIIFVTVGLANPDHIDMETGLPQESSLAMRYDAKSRSDRQIKAEEQKILEKHEAERAKDAVEKLRSTEQKKIDKKKVK